MPIEATIKPGKAVIEAIELEPLGEQNKEPVSITSLVSEMDVYESVLSPFMSITLTITDTINMLSYLPILGFGERLRVAFSVPEDKETSKQYEAEFLIYKIASLTKVGRTSQIYLLHGISEEAFENAKHRVSKKFRCSEKSIKRILSKYLRTEKDFFPYVKSWKTDSKSSCVVPNLRPIRAISLIEQYLGQEAGGRNMMFFERHRLDGDGSEFVLTSLEDLIEFGQETKTDDLIEFHFNPGEQINEDTGEFDTEVNRFRVRTFEVVRLRDGLENYRNGVEGSSMLTYDLTKKTWSKEKFLPTKDDVDPEQRLNKYGRRPPVVRETGESAESRIESVMPTTTGLFEQNVQNSQHIKNILKAKSVRRQLANFIVRCSIPGNTEIRCGDTIRLSVIAPDAEQEEKDVAMHKILNGRYIIANVQNVLVEDQYETIVELWRRSTTKEFTDVPEESRPKWFRKAIGDSA